MTLQEIIYNIKESVGADAEELTDRQFAFIIGYYRAKLIRQRIKAKEDLSPAFSPALHKIKVREIEDSDPGCEDMDCGIYKTDKDIPTVIPYSDNSTLLYLGSTDGYLPFQETSFQSLELERYAKFIAKEPKWFTMGSKYYITNPPDEQIDYITIQGVFEDPIAAAQLCDDFDVACLKNYDIEYPISGDMIDTITKLVRDNELGLLIKEIDEDDNSQR